MLSMKTQYALQALMYMAQEKRDTPVLIAEIAVKKNIPLKFLENILLQLKNSGILASKKGKGGGYFFAHPPESIRLATIMRLIDGPIALLPCVSLNFYAKCKNCDEDFCGLAACFSSLRKSDSATSTNRRPLIFNDCTVIS